MLCGPPCCRGRQRQRQRQTHSDIHTGVKRPEAEASAHASSVLGHSHIELKNTRVMTATAMFGVCVLCCMFCSHAHVASSSLPSFYQKCLSLYLWGLPFFFPYLSIYLSLGASLLSFNLFVLLFFQFSLSLSLSLICLCFVFFSLSPSL